MFSGGWFRVGTIYGAPVRLHFTLPLGAYFFVGLDPGAMLAFFLLILVHEAGHAALVVRAGARVERIDIHGLGGLCAWRGFVVPYQRALIAWGGVLAQAIVYGAALAWLRLHGPPDLSYSSSFFYVFLGPNLRIIGFNLLPIRPLDGAEAWPLLPMIWRRFTGERAHAAAKKAAQPPRLGSAEDSVDRDEDSLDADEEAERRREAHVQRILGDVLGAKKDARKPAKSRDPSPS